MAVAVEKFIDRLETCVVCGDRIKAGVAVLKDHTTGEYVTREELNKREGTPVHEDISVYYAGVYCFQSSNLRPYVAD